MATDPPTNPNATPPPRGPNENAQTDPAMEALLEAALAPETGANDWSETARDRTLAAMLDAAGSKAGSETPSPVVGRIGPGSTGLRWGVGLAAAAVFALAGAAVVITLSSGTNTDGDNLIAQGIETDTTDESATAQNDEAVVNPNQLAVNPDNREPAATIEDGGFEAQLAADLDAWSAAARGTGLDAEFGSTEALATASADSADWWNANPTADAYDDAFNAEAFRRELDAFSGSTDLVF
ncbi:MAG: hypothetical protein AAGH92_06305 [Planctomycetota bacterium]